VRILAIETATAASAVALGEDDAVHALTVSVDRRGHVGFLVPAIDFCFEQVGWQRDEIDIVAVDVGPGPFTGLRAGIATAQAFAAAVGAPLIGISSLTALAVRAATGRRRIWPVVDMRRGQVATRPFLPLPGGVVPDGPPEIVGPDEFHGLIESDPADTLVVGDWPAFPTGVWTGLHRARKGRPRYPAADVLLEIAAIRARNDDYGRPESVQPLYLREPDVQINWEQFRSEGAWPAS
jgi:tRNA threonylcarbamoyladenosine biosynthesis protein TsaB